MWLFCYHVVSDFICCQTFNPFSCGVNLCSKGVVGGGDYKCIVGLNFMGYICHTNMLAEDIKIYKFVTCCCNKQKCSTVAIAFIWSHDDCFLHLVPVYL